MVRCDLASLRALDDVGEEALELLGTFKFKVAGSSFAIPKSSSPSAQSWRRAKAIIPKRQATSHGHPLHLPKKKKGKCEQRPASRYSHCLLHFSQKFARGLLYIEIHLNPVFLRFYSDIQLSPLPFRFKCISGANVEPFE